MGVCVNVYVYMSVCVCCESVCEYVCVNVSVYDTMCV